MELTQEGIQYLENSIDRGRPVPGQSLTNAKEQPYNWERSPEITDPREGMHVVFDALIEPEAASNVLLSVGSGVGVIDIASVILYLYKLIVLQPQGQLLTVLKTFFMTLRVKTSKMVRDYQGRTMLTDHSTIPVVTFFHAPSDPHSTILLQALKILITKYNIPNNRVQLMTQASTKEEISTREKSISELAKANNFLFSPRLHVAMWGAQRGK